MSAAPLYSSEWFEHLAASLRAIAPETDWPSLDLGVEVADGPDGGVRYTIHVGPQGADLEIGSVDSAKVTLVESFETARSIDQGESVAELLAQGRITVRGDATALVAAQRPLLAISAALASQKTSSDGGKSGL